MMAEKSFDMKKAFKSTFVIWLLGMVVPNAALAVPGYVPRFQNCAEPYELCWVMRCEIGSGSCNESAQYFCDEIC